MWFILVPLLTFMTLASRDDVTKYWDRKPHAGCHWLYRERGVVPGYGGWAWPAKRTNQVLCWQEGTLQ